MLHAVEEAFDDVAVLVIVGVVADGPAARAATFLAVRGLVGLLGDDGLNVSRAEQGTMAARAVGLVRAEHVRCRARTTGAAPGDPQFPKQQRQHRAVARMARPHDQRQRSTLAINEGVGLGAQTTTRAADAVIVGFVPADRRILVIRYRPPVWEDGPSFDLAVQVPC